MLLLHISLQDIHRVALAIYITIGVLRQESIGPLQAKIIDALTTAVHIITELLLTKNMALRTSIWSGNTSDISPFDSFHGFRFHESIQICGRRMRHHEYSFFSNYLTLMLGHLPQLNKAQPYKTSLSLPRYHTVIIVSHEDMAFFPFCGHLSWNRTMLHA